MHGPPDPGDGKGAARSDAPRIDPLGKGIERESNQAPSDQQARIETDHDRGQPRFVSVFNGDDLLGHIAVARSIRALTPDNIEIGTFNSEMAARKAIVRHAFGAGGGE